MNKTQKIAIEKAYNDLENIIKLFPKDCQKNYFENKKDLKIIFDDVILESISGTYYHEENIITIYNISAIHHELFHMAARDRTKLNKKVFIDSNYLYHNGISYRINDTIILKGITEGFIEYLTRKCIESKSHQLSYYFVDLLISIYGEEIIHYVLKNEPIDFYENEMFYDINLFAKYMYRLEIALAYMEFLSNDKKIIEQAFVTNNIKKLQEIEKKINKCMESFKTSIIGLFKIIIDEFKHCSYRKICKNDFISKLNLFLLDSDYVFVFLLDNHIKPEIETIIQDFNNNYEICSNKISKTKVHKKERQF